MALLVAFRWQHIYQIDIRNEEVHVQPFPRLTSSDIVYRLHRAIYGPKQALHNGFKQFQYVKAGLPKAIIPCTLHLQVIVILLYFNNIIIDNDDLSTIAYLKQHLQCRYSLRWTSVLFATLYVLKLLLLDRAIWLSSKSSLISFIMHIYLILALVTLYWSFT